MLRYRAKTQMVTATQACCTIDEGPNTPLTQDILDRIQKNRVKVQNEALGKDTDVSNVTRLIPNKCERLELKLPAVQVMTKWTEMMMVVIQTQKFERMWQVAMEQSPNPQDDYQDGLQTFWWNRTGSR